MKIELRPYESRTLEALKQKFSLERDLTVGIAQDLHLLARLFEQVVTYPDCEFRAGRVVIMGLLNHVHCLLIGGLHAVEVGNYAVWSNCARGLIETLGACVLILKSPLSAPSYLKHVNATKLYNAAATARPGLSKDIKRLHQIVHPASEAIYASRRTIDQYTNTVTFEFGLNSTISPNDAREGVIYLGNIAGLIVEKLEKLVSNNDVLSAGSVIMERAAKT